MSKLNPLSPYDKEIKRIEPEVETDTFGEEEARKIVDMVILDVENDVKALREWFDQRKRDIQMYEGEKPSVLEGLTKKGWMSDRNLKLTTAICDIYQATLLTTCYNPDMIYFKSSQYNETNNKDNLEKFARWAVGEYEGNVFPEIDDFIANRVQQGFSVFEVYWKVWYEWVDRRIPKKDENGQFSGYDIKTEYMRFEKGVIENIDNLEDFLCPNYSKHIQELDHCIRVIHKTGDVLLEEAERGVYKNVDEKFITKLKGTCYEYIVKTISEEKARSLGIKTSYDISSNDLRVYPIDLYKWFGYYQKNGKREKYRFIVEPITKTLLSIKPLRKVNRTGKYPFIGGALIRRPGFLRGHSIPKLIDSVTNAINNVYNQKSDFQYVTNCPFGFWIPDERYRKQVEFLEPMALYPTDQPDKINFPNIQRSMAWAYQDINFLLEVLERLTGAASYFMSNQKGVSGTATRDVIIKEKGETKFGLWVKRIITDISEAITMYINLYQDWAPPKLGERVVGEDGKKLFPNLSIDTLRGNYNAYLEPDLISGSKTLEKEIAMWVDDRMQANPWFNPQINPKGSWQLTVDNYKKIGLSEVEKYMPPQPEGQLGTSAEVDGEWTRFMNGEDVEVTGNPIEHFMGHVRQRQEKYHELDDEYKSNFDDHLFTTYMQYLDFLKKIQEEQIANQFAANTVRSLQNEQSRQ